MKLDAKIVGVSGCDEDICTRLTDLWRHCSTSLPFVAWRCKRMLWKNLILNCLLQERFRTWFCIFFNLYACNKFISLHFPLQKDCDVKIDSNTIMVLLVTIQWIQPLWLPSSHTKKRLCLINLSSLLGYDGENSHQSYFNRPQQGVKLFWRLASSCQLGAIGC